MKGQWAVAMLPALLVLLMSSGALAATISGSVFNDSTGSVENEFDSGDAGLVGVTVSLFRDSDGDGAPEGAAIDTTLTGPSGEYSFTGLSFGGYVVQEEDPVGFISVRDFDGGDPSAGRIAVVLGGLSPVIEEFNLGSLTAGAVVGTTNSQTVNGAVVNFDIFEVGTADYDRTAHDDPSNPGNSPFSFLIQSSDLADGNAFTGGSPTVSGQTPDTVNVTNFVVYRMTFSKPLDIEGLTISDFDGDFDTDPDDYHDAGAIVVEDSTGNLFSPTPDSLGSQLETYTANLVNASNVDATFNGLPTPFPLEPYRNSQHIPSGGGTQGPNLQPGSPEGFAIYNSLTDIVGIYVLYWNELDGPDAADAASPDDTQGISFWGNLEFSQEPADSLGNDFLDKPDLQYDVALVKSNATPSQVNPGGNVSFDITVTNQSRHPVDPAILLPIRDVEISAYLGGWELNDANWSPGPGDTAVRILPGPLAPNSPFVTSITLTAPEVIDGSYQCYAEVTGFKDDNLQDVTDVDSSANIGAGGDSSEQDDVTNGTGGDHDDLDPGTIEVVNLVYDVGLIKTGATPPVQQPGGDVTFTFTVTNQSRNPLNVNDNVPVTAVRVSDYLPAGFSFNASKNTALALGETGIHSGWSGATPTTTLTSPLDSGASRSFSIVLTANNPAVDGTYVNYGEVVDFRDADGDPVVDNDSEAIVGYQGDLGAENDNNITDPNDHDDLDPESVGLVNYEYDVALINTSPTPSSIHPGDDVCFTITVTNQSRNPVNAADNVVVSNVVVRDFIPEGFSLDPAKNTAAALGAVGVHTGWQNGGQTATTTLLGDLSKDASRSIKIILTADQELENDVYINYAEVIAFEDDQGRAQEDIDSDSDIGPNGDPNEINNVTNGTLPNQDHDDLDPEPVTIVNYLYDLALRKVSSPGDPIEPGDEALFTITVINQSVDPIDANANVPVQNVQIVDYLPEGFSLSPNESNWAASGVQQARLITPIALLNTRPNDSVSVQILLRANDPFEDATLDNYAEIASFEDPQGNTRPDVDSEPSSNAGGDLQLVDNEINAGGPGASQDEDDHDIASIDVVNPIYDLAIQKLNATPAAVQPGEDVTFTIRVLNQSYKPLNSDANVPVTQVQVHDYIPVGFILSPEEVNWEAVGNGVARLVTPIAQINSQGVNFIDLTIKLRPEYPLENGNYDNYAEIAAFLDEDGDVREDHDSTPSNNQGGDGNLVDNQIDGGGPNAGQDEDDHDIESVQVVNPLFDLALVKTHASPEIVAPGGDVTFTIRVTNQSVNPINLARNVPVANIQVVDYIPEGFTLSADALGWVQVGDTAVLATPIASLDSVGNDTYETTIRLTANDPLSRGDYANYAEITSFEDSFGNNVPDVDSTPDDINDEPNGTIADDDINNQNGDEDDHDVEVVTVGQLVDPKFDLALRKRVAPNQSPTVNPGDLVTFDIEVFNQGTIAADSIRLVDYIRPGFELADNNWSGPIAGADVNAVLYSAPIGLLLPGQSSVVNITLRVDENAEYPLTLENYAEIFEARDGVGTIRSDDDSTPDGNAGDLMVDNEINDDGSSDEDDHDIATVELNEPGAYDLALRKTLATGQSNTVNVGDTVTFRVEVFNQGAVDASNVQVVDYIPTMLEVVDPSWTVNAAGTRATLANVLGNIPAGGSAAVNITFRVKEGAEGDIDNFAEILTDDGDDRDSRPESQEQNGSADVIQDDLINDDGTNDEDDHDVATVTINPPERYDLALRKTLAVWQSPQVNRGENVTFTLEVFNQGAQEARQITLIDYIPEGLTLNDGNWIPNATGTRATLATPIASIAPSSSARVNISFTVDANAEGQLDNYAEIQIDDGDDADSIPEIDEGNDERDALINNEINNDGTSDEDDHDIASVEVNPPTEFDLALRKQLQSGQSPTVNPGDTVTFTIEVFNQGAVPAANVVVIDYIKPGMTLADNAWTERPGGYLEHNAALGIIDPGQSALVTITMVVNEDAEGELACNAEILSATDINGVPGNDSDSTPDNIDTDPIIDDEINDNGVFDEDDHDTAGVTVNPPGRFDLALRKRLASGQASGINPGDLVNFELEVFNQGAVTADNVQLVDYIQPGFTLEDPNWSLQGTTAFYNNPLSNLEPGNSRTVTITLRVDADLVGPTTLENLAEIFSATGEDNAEVTDADSTPDDESTDKLIENEINDDGTLDEDDHDIAYIDINAPDKYDLALRHTLAAGQALNVNTGDCVEFTTEVFNQGAAVAEDVQVIVYLSSQLAFIDSGANALWNYNSATHTATTTLLGTLPTGGSRAVEIKTEVRSGANGTLINTAEIFADDGEDCDSSPDGVNNEVAVDDAINGEAGDEDDHDIAVVGINEPGTFDLALRKRLANGQSTSVNPGDRVTFEIEVFNQGAVAADNIEVIDYLQTGFTLADANWGAAGQNAIFGQRLGVLQPGESEVITITLEVGSNLVGPLVLRNLAEITSATGENDAAVTDVDSIPDFINGDRLVDDQINDDGTIDEDDHDVATVSVNTPDRYDLALRKSIANGQSVMVNPGELVTYTIEVFNQGAVDAFDIDVVDFIPAGLTLEDPSWDDNAAGTQAFLVNKLPLVAAGKSARVNITFRVAENATGQIINAAEINTDDGDDADSRPEDQENNNSGDLVVDDEINDEGNTDEDDHDIAVIGINPPGTFDLALRKRLASGQSNSVNPGDTVQFEIEVFNQGAVPATDIEVVVYPRPGLLLDDSAWTLVGNYLRHNALLGTIQPGQSTSVAINLQIDPNVQGPTTLDCTAEISVAQDQVLNRPGNDIDSTPDTQDSDQLVDNEINDDGTFDEDDHDIGYINVNAPGTLDLALRKRLSNGQSITVNPGDSVSYEIEIFNQGSVDAKDIQVVDYIDTAAFVLSDSNWSIQGINTAVYGIDLGILKPGESQVIGITLEVRSDLVGPATLANHAEISEGRNDSPGILADIDSNPDTAPGDLVIDDRINDDGTFDEDDHDVAYVEINEPGVFDLALRKTLALGQNQTVQEGDLVTFTVEVFNQGAVDATDIEICDYIPAGFQLQDSSWAAQGTGVGPDMAQFTINGVLAAGESTTVDLTMRVLEGATDETLIAYAEISDYLPNVSDIDSVADGIADNDNGGRPDVNGQDNEINGNGFIDEDDHDPAYVTLVKPGDFDLALRKKLAPGFTIMMRRGADHGFRIELFNQGAETATNIKVVDYIPEYFILSPNDNNGWQPNGTPQQVVLTVPGPLAPGESTTVGILLQSDPLVPLGVNFFNTAEIYGASDTNGDPIDDIDSNYDTDDDDTLVDDAINNENGDEDDHDIADPIAFLPFDLALRKRLAEGQSSKVNPGETITFEIDIVNQGSVPASNVQVADHAPAGLTLADAHWINIAGVIELRSTIGIIEPGELVTVPITFIVDEGLEGPLSLTNTAEIASATDDEGNPVTDSDSTPDNDPDNEENVRDDELDNGGGDEDDHDIAVIEINPPGVYDLALRKTLASNQALNVQPGDSVTFVLEVFNQGALPATNVEVTDYLTPDLILTDGNWDEVDGKATRTIVGTIPAGESVTTTIRFRVADGVAPGEITCLAEISDDNNPTSEPDPDSTPDSDPTNDGDPVDNELDGESGDEDDSDPATINVLESDVFDLALRKRLASGQSASVNPGDAVIYEIDVVNQGAINAANIQLVDNYPASLILADPNWIELSSGVAEYKSLIGVLEPGDVSTVAVTFTVATDVQGPLSLTNVAEIRSATDEDGQPQEDTDSTPDNTPDNDGPVRDDALHNEDGDEDDNDIAVIEVNPPGAFDLALRKTLASDQPLNVQPGDNVTFILEVFNQGAVDASGVTVGLHAGTNLTLNDGNWSVENGIVQRVVPGVIPPGGSVAISLTMTVVEVAQPGSINCFAEIIDDNDPTGAGDQDSTPDSTPGNDGTPINDAINGEGGDEDDHDGATINVLEPDSFDLALRKRLAEGQSPNVNPGDLISFEIEVFNQGDIAATNVQVASHLGAAVELVDSGWTKFGDLALLKSTLGVIEPGQSQIVGLTLRLREDVNAPADLQCLAEIVSATDIDGDPQTDIDSTPNLDPDDDLLVDDFINDDGALDEDDHDGTNFHVNEPGSFDLALITTLAPGQSPNVNPGDKVVFRTRVFNQGELDARNIVINNIIPEGLSLADDNWVLIDGQAVNVISGGLLAGQSATIDICFVVNDDAPEEIVSIAEIGSATDADGNPVTDIDSTPDNDPDNEGLVRDDELDNALGDEDDHDIVKLQLNEPGTPDVALRKSLAEGQSPDVARGDVVCFTLEVFNQGSIPVQQIKVCDYVPAGMRFDPALNDEWRAEAADVVSCIIPGPILPGESFGINVCLTVDEDAPTDAFIKNCAEICAFRDSNGDLLADGDSVVDNIPDNDGRVEDDALNGEKFDEDDHDCEQVYVREPDTYDLALRTTLSPGQDTTAARGDDVCFTIEVFNQGEVPANDIRVCDHIPAGLEFNSLENPAWTNLGGGRVVCVIPGPLAPGASHAIEICYTVADDAPIGECLTHTAEICGDDGDDADSTADNDALNDGRVTDNAINGEAFDEDDHDTACVIVSAPDEFDLALRTSVPTGQPESANPGDTMTLNVEVFNQGAVPAYNVSTVAYLPEGLTLAPGQQWQSNASGQPEVTVFGPIQPGNSLTFPIRVLVDDDATPGELSLGVELTGATDLVGNPLVDGDSVMDNIPGNDGFVTNDEISGQNGDQDDHDLVTIGVNEPQRFDLALRKRLASGQSPTVNAGDQVTYEIEVFNQGAIAAQNVRVYDYYPSEALTLSDDLWTEGVLLGAVVCEIPGPIEPGQSASIPITFTVNDDAEGSFDNVAEICEAQDIHGNQREDADGTFDKKPNNDRIIDNLITDDSVDSDDHDIETVEINEAARFDLALRQRLAPGQSASVNPCDEVQFTVEVFNQGAVPASDISIVSYIPEGFSLADSSWSATDELGLVECLIRGPIEPGQSGLFNLTLKVDEGAEGELTSCTEIASAHNAAGELMMDADSIADSLSNNDRVVDNEINQNGVDEDDHDCETISINPPAVFDLALRTTIGADQSRDVHRNDSVHLVVEVFNQGAQTATNIKVISYLPAHLELNDSQWTLDADGNACRTIPGPMEAGLSGVLDMIVKVKDSAPLDSIVAVTAEIVSAQNEQGLATLDLDSIPDNIANNDGPLVDNEINNENGDQDDFDVVYLAVIEPDVSEPTIAMLGDTIWEDLNRNGQQDDGEPGIGGINVVLLDSSGNPTGQQMTTDVTGRYKFEVEAPGTYQIKVDVPNGYSVTTPNQGNDATDSDIDPDTHITVTPISVVAGMSYPTLDAGLYRASSIGGVVWNDTDRDGVRDQDEQGIAGISVSLCDGEGQPIGDPVLTEADGSYLFTDLAPGEYQVHCASPEGHHYSPQDVGNDNSDSDVNPTTGSTVTTFLSAGETDLSWFCGLYAIDPDSFEVWAEVTPGASSDPTGNNDGDLFDDTLEFALGTPPSTGSNGQDGFCIELDEAGRICALITRPTGGAPGVTYTLEVSDTLLDSNAWMAVTGISPEITDNGDGTETLNYCGVDTAVSDKQFSGFVRLRVDLASPQSTSHTEIFGWQATVVKEQCETFNQPFVKKPLYVGVIGESNGSAFIVSEASGEMPDMPLDKSLYIEVIDGEHEGHRFDVIVSGKRVIAIEEDSARNTHGSLPDNLSGSRFMLREHCTVDDLFKKVHFFGTRDPLTADRLLFFAGEGFESVFLLDGLGFFQWTDESDISLNDQGNRVVGPCEGLFVHPRNGQVTIRSYGMVRSNKLRCPLKAGYNFVGGGWPVDQSPADRGMTIEAGFTGARDSQNADVIQLWIGDQVAGIEAYSGLYLLDATLGNSSLRYWTDLTDLSIPNKDDFEMFQRDRSAFIFSQDGLEDWCLEVPWKD